MNGPCLCGDPYCPRCGNPSLADIENAEAAMWDKLNEENLTADEYETVMIVGLAAVKAQRDLLIRMEKQRAEDAYFDQVQDQILNI